MLITLYGINNIGKTTQAKRLVEMLRDAGYDTEYVKYPVYDVEPSGKFINGVLRGETEVSEEALQIWFTANRYQFEPKLTSWLSEGKIVVAEDYVGTGIAWGTVKGAEMEWLEKINEGLLKEDLAVVLTGKRNIGAKEEGHAHEDNEEYMRRSVEVHEDLAERYGWKPVEVITGDIEGTADRIWGIVRLHLPEKSA